MDQLIFYSYERIQDISTDEWHWRYVAEDYRIVPSSARYPLRGTAEYIEARDAWRRENWDAYIATWIGHKMVPTYNYRTGMYEAIFWDKSDKCLRHIITPVFREIFTPFDPERISRSYFPMGRRRELLDPAKIQWWEVEN